MSCQWYAHLPGVVLDYTDDITIGRIRLVQLPFDDWIQLDDTFGYAQTDYEKSQPVFYVGESSISGDIDSIRTQVLDKVHLLYLAFLLEPGTPLLPPPQMSVIYIRIPVPGDEVLRAFTSNLIGPFEREWIIYGNRISYTFDEVRLSLVHESYEVLTKHDSNNAFQGVEAGLHTISLTARPEFWWGNRGLNRINEFIHNMTALEHILLPPKEEAPRGMRLTPTFGKHAAVFSSPSREDLPERTKNYSALYRLRSRLIHGEIGITDINDEEWGKLLQGRRLLRNVILHAIILKQTTYGEESLPLLLEESYKNAEIHKSIFERIQEVL